jgi:hypothetical protein
MLELRVYASLLHPESESAGSVDSMGVTIVRISLKACGREQPLAMPSTSAPSVWSSATALKEVSNDRKNPIGIQRVDEL